jgi:hypothetical protein
MLAMIGKHGHTATVTESPGNMRSCCETGEVCNQITDAVAAGWDMKVT